MREGQAAELREHRSSAGGSSRSAKGTKCGQDAQTYCPLRFLTSPSEWITARFSASISSGHDARDAEDCFCFAHRPCYVRHFLGRD
jgi:hypothetical protein